MVGNTLNVQSRDHTHSGIPVVRNVGNRTSIHDGMGTVRGITPFLYNTHTQTRSTTLHSHGGYGLHGYNVRSASDVPIRRRHTIKGRWTLSYDGRQEVKPPDRVRGCRGPPHGGCYNIFQNRRGYRGCAICKNPHPYILCGAGGGIADRDYMDYTRYPRLAICVKRCSLSGSPSPKNGPRVQTRRWPSRSASRNPISVMSYRTSRTRASDTSQSLFADIVKSSPPAWIGSSYTASTHMAVPQTMLRFVGEDICSLITEYAVKVLLYVRLLRTFGRTTQAPIIAGGAV